MLTDVEPQATTPLDAPKRLTAASTPAPPTARPTSVRRDVVLAVGAAVALTAASYGLGLIAGWITDVEWLEALAVAASYACTALCIVQRRVNYVIGAVGTALYAVLFFRHGLIASAFLNVYLTPQLVYGWFRWRRDDQTRPVTWLLADLRWVPAYLGVTIAAYLGGAWLVRALDGQLAWADSAILAGSILAQFLLDNKRIETWFVWIAVNVLAVWTYVAAGLVVAGLQYVIFIGTAVMGFTAWLRSTR